MHSLIYVNRTIVQVVCKTLARMVIQVDLIGKAVHRASLPTAEYVTTAIRLVVILIYLKQIVHTKTT